MKCGFSITEVGVGGRAVVVPIAREGVGGWVGRRVRLCEDAVVGEGKTYCCVVRRCVGCCGCVDYVERERRDIA